MKFARRFYCQESCQQVDWKRRHKLFHKELRRSQREQTGATNRKNDGNETNKDEIIDQENENCKMESQEDGDLDSYFNYLQVIDFMCDVE